MLNGLCWNDSYTIAQYLEHCWPQAKVLCASPGGDSQFSFSVPSASEYLVFLFRFLCSVQKLSKEEKEKRRAEREIRREEKKRKTKKWKKEEVERLRQEANARYVRIFKTSLQESPTRSEEALVPMFVEVCVEFIEANGEFQLVCLVTGLQSAHFIHRPGFLE